jgi:hypothetical protein
MLTECSGRTFEFQGLGSRVVTGRFDGGAITSDAGGLLLREVEARTGVVRRFAACFSDFRNPDLAEHTAYELIGQRVFGLALGYEDVNDHDALRYDPLLAVLVALRQHGLRGTEMAHARCDTIRLKLLKLGAVVRTTVRRVWISLAESCPYQRVFAQVYENLKRWSLPPPLPAPS